MPVKSEVDKILIEHGIANTPAARKAAIQVSPEDFHPNALGHEAYARALTKALFCTLLGVSQINERSNLI